MNAHVKEVDHGARDDRFRGGLAHTGRQRDPRDRFEEARVEIELRRGRGAATFVYRIELQGPLDERARVVLLAAAERCPVRQTLSGDLRFEGR